MVHWDQVSCVYLYENKYKIDTCNPWFVCSQPTQNEIYFGQLAIQEARTEILNQFFFHCAEGYDAANILLPGDTSQL